MHSNTFCNTNILQIRKAEVKNLPDVLVIEEKCGLAKWTPDDYRKEINRENSLFLVAKIKNRTVGFLLARLATPELDIVNIGVHPKHQKMGVGSSLLNELTTRTYKTRVESIWLEVRESNSKAIEFYRKRGFRQTQVRKNFYTQPMEDAIIMSFELRNSSAKY